MLAVNLFSGLSRAPRCLFLGAHSDDIELGCGGSLLELLALKPELEVDWVVFSSNDVREAETRAAALQLLGEKNAARVEVLRFRNSFFPQQATEIKEYFESIKNRFDPDVVFTHFRDDLHQDHRTIGELTWNTFRNHLILEYEIPKYDGGLGSPGVFMPISKQTLDRKISILMDTFASQRSKGWFTEETFRALPRLRGIECNAAEGFAEAFYCRKLSLTA